MWWELVRKIYEAVELIGSDAITVQLVPKTRGDVEMVCVDVKYADTLIYTAFTSEKVKLSPEELKEEILDGLNALYSDMRRILMENSE